MKKQLKDARSFDELLDIEYGKKGNKKRDAFEKNARAFVMNEGSNGNGNGGTPDATVWGYITGGLTNIDKTNRRPELEPSADR